jgi:hypothetical protein
MKAKNTVDGPASKPFSPYALIAVVAVLALVGIVFLMQQNSVPAVPPAAPAAAQPAAPQSPALPAEIDRPSQPPTTTVRALNNSSNPALGPNAPLPIVILPNISAPILAPNATPNLPAVPVNVHGCVASEGYVWCELKSKCLRPAMENCTTISISDARKYCVGNNSVVMCEDYIRVISKTPAGSTFYKQGETTSVFCPSVPKSSMNATCRNLVYEKKCIIPVVC